MRISPVSRYATLHDSIRIGSMTNVTKVEKTERLKNEPFSNDISSRLLSQKEYEDFHLNYHTHRLYTISLQHGTAVTQPLQTEQEAVTTMTSVKEQLLSNPIDGYGTTARKNAKRVMNLLK